MLLAATLALCLLLAGTASGAPAEPEPQVGDIAFNGEQSNGVVRTTEPGQPCSDEGGVVDEGRAGSYRHYFAEAPLGDLAATSMQDTAPVFRNMPGSLRATLDVHYEQEDVAKPGPNAFLHADDSHVTISNERGFIQVTLRGGRCSEPGATFDGTSANAQGAWNEVTGTGAYREITGSGTFALEAEMNPGADNVWSLSLDGNLDVLQPRLYARQVKSYWGSLGLDYLENIVTVVYRVGNVPDPDDGNARDRGDAFGTRFLSVEVPSGVKVCGGPRRTLLACPDVAPPQEPLGDLATCDDESLPPECDSELLVLRYHIHPLDGPCFLVTLDCTFETTLVVKMADALDNERDHVFPVTVTTPALPPPL